MNTIVLLLIIFTLIWSRLSAYIKNFKVGYKSESDQSFWMMSYDFKADKKQDYNPDSLLFRNRKKFKNKLIFILYINVIILFLLMNSFVSQLLILISK